MKGISEDLLKKCRAGFDNDAAAHTLNAAMAKTEFADLAFVPVNAAKLNGDFEIEIKTHGITAQQKSGRCWLFAAMNIMREEVMKKCNIDSFEISGNYLAFYDKLEKANNFLEMVIDNASLTLDERMMEHILHGIGDGGYWDMAANLVAKYGVVPKDAMPESYQSTHTDKFMRLLNTLLRKDACELRELIAAGKDVTVRKEEMLAEVYKAECIVFGEPVESFDFCYRNKDGKFTADNGITPKEFFDKYVGINLFDYVTITNEPTIIKELGKTYTWHSSYCMADKNLFCLNLSIEELKDLCIAQLKGGEPVWFACDSGQYGSRKDGVWDQDSLDFEGLLGGVSLDMKKTDRLSYRESYGTHAMILTGVNFDKNGKPNRYKIENSWGEEAGKKGYFVCSDKYFDEFVYEGIINKKYLSDAQKELLKQKPITIEPWLA